MTKKNKLFKIIGFTLICSCFIFLAYGSGDSANKELKNATKEEIIKILSSSELTDNIDQSADIDLLIYKISLKMNENKTFKYSFRVEKEGGYYDSMNATGTYELIGDIEKETQNDATDKYGDVVDTDNYVQKIRFKGKTNKGKDFTLNASLTEFKDKNEWFFWSNERSVSINQRLSIDNFELPSDNIYP